MIIKSRFSCKCIVCNKIIAVGSDIEWKKGEGSRHLKCKVEEVYNFPTWKIYGGSGYGCRGWSRGDVVRNNDELIKGAPEWLYVLSSKSKYFREDGLSFGVGIDSGYVYEATCRSATESEFAPVAAKRQAKIDEARMNRRIHDIGEEILRRGTRCDDIPMPAGEKIVWSIVYVYEAYMVIDGNTIHSYHPGFYDDYRCQHAVLVDAALAAEVIALSEKK